MLPRDQQSLTGVFSGCGSHAGRLGVLGSDPPSLGAALSQCGVRAVDGPPASSPLDGAALSRVLFWLLELLVGTSGVSFVLPAHLHSLPWPLTGLPGSPLNKAHAVSPCRSLLLGKLREDKECQPGLEVREGSWEKVA